MSKYTVAMVHRGTPILTDGKCYFVDDGFGDFYIFTNIDDAIWQIEGGD